VDPKILVLPHLKPKSMAKSAGNIFPAEFAQKSVEKTKNSSNGLACYKES